VIANGNSKDDDIGLQEQGLRNVYSFNKSKLAKKELGKYENHISGVLKLIDFSPDGKTFFELGFGNGFTLYAARNLGFNKVIGVDITIDLYKNLNRYFSEDNISVFTDIKMVNDKVDFIYLWHVLEHLSNPRNIFDKLREISNMGCYVAIQVPQYKKDHIFDAHHFFYTEKSIKLLLENSGFNVENIVYDISNEFMTVIGIRCR